MSRMKRSRSRWNRGLEEGMNGIATSVGLNAFVRGFEIDDGDVSDFEERLTAC